MTKDEQKQSFVHVRIGDTAETGDPSRIEEDEEVILIGADSAAAPEKQQSLQPSTTKTTDEDTGPALPCETASAALQDKGVTSGDLEGNENDLLVPMGMTQRIVIIGALIGVVVFIGFLVQHYFLA